MTPDQLNAALAAVALAKLQPDRDWLDYVNVFTTAVSSIFMVALTWRLVRNDDLRRLGDQLAELEKKNAQAVADKVTEENAFVEAVKTTLIAAKRTNRERIPILIEYGDALPDRRALLLVAVERYAEFMFPDNGPLTAFDMCRALDQRQPNTWPGWELRTVDVKAPRPGKPQTEPI